MLKRNDLVKQFEFIVKQEITNHNNSILASNKEINEIKNRIDSILKLIDDQKKVRDNQLIEARMSFQNSDIYAREQIRILFCNINDYTSEIKKQKDELLKYVFERTTDLLKCGEYHLFKLHLEKKFKEISENNEICINNLVHSEKRLNDSIKKNLKEIEDLQKTTVIQINYANDILKKEIDIYKLNNQSLLREIEILKKRQFIQEKMIEDLYELIKRIDCNIVKTNSSHIKG